MNILLDLDGTLTNPQVGILTSLQYALRELGEDVPPLDELHWCIGPPLKDAFVTMLGSDQTERIEAGVTFFRERFGDIGLFENEVYEGIPEALALLRDQGYQLHLATSKPEIFARKILQHFDLTPFFRTINGSELDGTRSDKGELIQQILANNDIPPVQAVMVGDRKHDILGALQNRIAGVGVLWGFGTPQELTEAGASLSLESPEKLPYAASLLPTFNH